MWLDLLRWVGILLLATTCLLVGAWLGGFAVLHHFRKIGPAKVLKLVEYAEFLHTCDAEVVIGGLELEAYVEIAEFLRNKEEKGIKSLTKYELQALQKFKSYRDRYSSLSGPEPKRYVELTNRIDKYLERVPWAPEDQVRRDFLARYKSGEPEQAPALGEVMWLTGEGKPPLLDGKVVLVDFWGLQCQPCLDSFPALQGLYDKYRDRGMEVVAIHAQHAEESEIKTFLLENRYTFPAGQGTSPLCRKFWVRALPSYFLVDRQGRLVWGPEHGLPDEALLEQLLTGNPGPTEVGGKK
jgi:thiol-disulfide isomerase/thioredoxin